MKHPPTAPDCQSSIRTVPRQGAVLADPKGREWYDLVQQGEGGKAALDMVGLFSQGKFPKALRYAPGTRPYNDAWQETIDVAEAFNEPGRFSAVIGYEWTSLVKGANMHRNVIFRDNGESISPSEPGLRRLRGEHS